MGVPKRKTSKMRRRQRQAQIRRPMPSSSKCAKCGAPAQPHRVCTACGSYHGRQVLVISADED
jgi:large subunit ribosomal protein L32